VNTANRCRPRKGFLQRGWPGAYQMILVALTRNPGLPPMLGGATTTVAAPAHSTRGKAVLQKPVGVGPGSGTVAHTQPRSS
jgi:hypothetical protein